MAKKKPAAKAAKKVVPDAPPPRSETEARRKVVNNVLDFDARRKERIEQFKKEREDAEEIGEGEARGKIREKKVWPIDPADEPGMYETVNQLIEAHHAHDLADAMVGLVWSTQWHQDIDGNVKLASTKACSELEQRTTGFDFFITINQEAWPDLKEKGQLALLDHELCHCAPVIEQGESGEQAKDETGRLLWRARKHPIEEFPEVVERHGLWTRQLVELAKAAKSARRAPLFAKAHGEDGEAAAAPEAEEAEEA